MAKKQVKDKKNKLVDKVMMILITKYQLESINLLSKKTLH